jgi:hypothetical protein
MTRKAGHGTTARPEQEQKPRRRNPPKAPRPVTIEVVIENTPPDAARLAAHRRALETLLAIMARD